jgi:fatty acid synthase subunit alpha
VRAGAVIWVPRAMKFDRFIAGQIPTGWDAVRYGVPPNIAAEVDPVTLFALVSTVEAFVAAGITDPYEFYQYVHVSEVGNCSGGGMGGMRSLKRLFFHRKMETDIPSDTLAESFINTMPAWINMLLLSSSGPIKTPVGACATAAESVEIGCETILSGKARVVIVGGYDDFGEEGSYEFAAMGATCNTELDAAKGRAVTEASRPMTSSRAGFVEAQGAGMQLLMDAELAIKMGLPIYAVVGLTNTATDREGRSVPAPGQVGHSSYDQNRR